MARLYLYCVETFGRGQTSQLFSEVSRLIRARSDCQLLVTTPNNPASLGVVKLSLAQNAYERLQAASDKESLPFDQVIGFTSMSESIDKLAAYQSRLLVTKDESSLGHMFVNGKYSAFGSVSISSASSTGVLTSSTGPIPSRTN
jgi:hypothetical protein